MASFSKDSEPMTTERMLEVIRSGWEPKTLRDLHQSKAKQKEERERRQKAKANAGAKAAVAMFSGTTETNGKERKMVRRK